MRKKRLRMASLLNYQDDQNDWKIKKRKKLIWLDEICCLPKETKVWEKRFRSWQQDQYGSHRNLEADVIIPFSHPKKKQISSFLSREVPPSKKNSYFPPPRPHLFIDKYNFFFKVEIFWIVRFNRSTLLIQSICKYIQRHSTLLFLFNRRHRHSLKIIQNYSRETISDCKKQTEFNEFDVITSLWRHSATSSLKDEFFNCLAKNKKQKKNFSTFDQFLEIF